MVVLPLAASTYTCTCVSFLWRVQSYCTTYSRARMGASKLVISHIPILRAQHLSVRVALTHKHIMHLSGIPLHHLPPSPLRPIPSPSLSFPTLSWLTSHCYSHVLPSSHTHICIFCALLFLSFSHCHLSVHSIAERAQLSLHLSLFAVSKLKIIPHSIQVELQRLLQPTSLRRFLHPLFLLRGRPHYRNYKYPMECYTTLYNIFINIMPHHVTICYVYPESKTNIMISRQGNASLNLNSKKHNIKKR